MNPQGPLVSNMLLGRSGETVPEKNEEAQPKQKQNPVLDMSGGESKV